MQEFAKNLFTVRRDQVDLKLIFDHLRNYLICGAVFYAGNVLVSQAAVGNKLPYFGMVTVWFLQVLAFLLSSLNFTYGLFAVRALSEKPWNPWLFAVFTVCLFFAFQQLVVAR